MELSEQKCKGCEGWGFVWRPHSPTPETILTKDRNGWVTCSECNVHGRKHTLEDAVRIAALCRENERLKQALHFYAEPYGRRDSNGDEIYVPDFYSEYEFGETAKEALKEAGDETE